MCSQIINRDFNNVKVTCYRIDNTLHVQSNKFDSGVPTFLLQIFSSQSYKAHHMGVSCVISSLSTNRITVLDRWSRVEEAVNSLNNMEVTHKKEVLSQHRHAMGVKQIGERRYSVDEMTRAFEYFATSRATYNKLREDYELPSIRTLTRLTSKVGNCDDLTFIKEIFSHLGERQKVCILMVDEVYVKASLCYHGGTVFGRAVNDPTKLARTVLGIMVKCLFGGPKFLVKMLPVRDLTSDFQFEQVSIVLDHLKKLWSTGSSCYW